MAIPIPAFAELSTETSYEEAQQVVVSKNIETGEITAYTMCESAYIVPVPFSTWTELPEHVTHHYIDDFFENLLWTHLPEHVQHSYIDPVPFAVDRITNTEVSPYNAVVYIETLWPNGRRTVGTGFLLRPDMIITAGHNMFSMPHGGWATTNVIIPAANGGNTPFGFVWPSTISVGGGWINTGNVNDDWAIIRTSTRVNTSVFQTPNLTSDQLSAQTNIITVGYPGNRTFRTMWRSRPGSVRSVSSFLFTTDNSTYYGMSGGPVYNARGQAIGIHVGKNRFDTAQAVRFGPDLLLWISRQ